MMRGIILPRNEAHNDLAEMREESVTARDRRILEFPLLTLLRMAVFGISPVPAPSRRSAGR